MAAPLSTVGVLGLVLALLGATPGTAAGNFYATAGDRSNFPSVSQCRDWLHGRGANAGRAGDNDMARAKRKYRNVRIGRLDHRRKLAGFYVTVLRASREERRGRRWVKVRSAASCTHQPKTGFKTDMILGVL